MRAEKANAPRPRGLYARTMIPNSLHASSMPFSSITRVQAESMNNKEMISMTEVPRYWRSRNHKFADSHSTSMKSILATAFARLKVATEHYAITRNHFRFSMIFRPCEISERRRLKLTSESPRYLHFPSFLAISISATVSSIGLSFPRSHQLLYPRLPIQPFENLRKVLLTRWDPYGASPKRRERILDAW